MKSIRAAITLLAALVVHGTASGAATPPGQKTCFEYENTCYDKPREACEAVAKARRADRTVENPYDRVVDSKDAGNSFWCKLADKNGNETDQHYGEKRVIGADQASAEGKSEPADKKTEPLPWSRKRIAEISGKRVIVGMHAKVTLKDGVAALDGLRPTTAFAQLKGNPKQVDALGNGGVVAQLPEIQVRKGHQRSSGYILKPANPKSSAIEFVSWNTGEPVQDYNASHAEHQFCDYISSTGAWLANVKTIEISVFGRDICAQCDFDIRRLEKIVKERSPTATVTARRAD